MTEMKQTLGSSLEEAQSRVLGIFKITRYTNAGIELIVEINEHSFITIRIGSLLGLSTTHYSIGDDLGRIIMFPENKTLSEMMNDPLGFDKWYKNNVLMPDPVDVWAFYNVNH